jgi:hypothetical protein
MDRTSASMQTPTRIVGAACLLAALILPVAGAWAQEAGWEPLFNGRDLSGWAHVGGGRFVVEDGLLRTEGGMGLLWYTGRKFSDVAIRVVYRSVDNSNSGVFIRIPEPPARPREAVDRGYEVQIHDRPDPYRTTGTLYSMTRALARAPVAADWNTMEIHLDGDRTLVWVNGVLVTDFTEGDPIRRRGWPWTPRRGPRPTEGYIGLQNHARRDVVFFREISVRELEP